MTPARPANQRGAARLGAVQALYQMDVGGTPLPAVIAEFEAHRLGEEVEGEQLRPADRPFFRALVAGVVKAQRQIDPIIHAALPPTWPLTRIDLTLRAVLRCGVYELLSRPRHTGARRHHRICRYRQRLLHGRRAGAGERPSRPRGARRPARGILQGRGRLIARAARRAFNHRPLLPSACGGGRIRSPRRCRGHSAAARPRARRHHRHGRAERAFPGRSAGHDREKGASREPLRPCGEGRDAARPMC